MRLFVAIEVDASSFRDDIEAVRKAVKCRAKFVDTKAMHITLKFLGDLSSQELPKITKALDSLEGFGPLDIKLSGLGVFPSPERTRVLWVGALSDALPNLAASVESLLKEYGPPPKFHGHLTLARIRELCDLTKLVGRYSGRLFQEFTADSIVLKESILMPAGPIYKTVHKVKL